MSEKKEEIVEHNSVETTTDISAPAGERMEVTESGSVTTEVTTTNSPVPDKIEALEDDE